MKICIKYFIIYIYIIIYINNNSKKRNPRQYIEIFI